VSTITILAPPLRDRGDDVLLLAERMLERFSAKYAKPLTGFSSDALDALAGYSWPGNVRELVSAIERAVLVSRGEVVEADGMALGGRLCSRRSVSLPSSGGIVLPFGNRHRPVGDVIATRDDISSDGSGRIETLAELERGAIVRALRLLKGNKTAVADSLGIYRALLYAKMRRYRLSDDLSEEDIESKKDLEKPIGAVGKVAAANADAGDGRPVERLERAIARSGRRS
jgi:two-component system response regulator HydG